LDTATSSETGDPSKHKSGTKYLLFLAVTAIGVVYGDIGTSPLYAVRECFHGPHAIEPTHENVMGVLSLIFWAIVLIVTIKYHLIIIRANNEGEGGILALMQLVIPKNKSTKYYILLSLGLFGASLLYGDGIITPAITVTSAIEGLTIATPFFEKLVTPISIIILILLFSFQYKGTGRVGSLFGPVIIIWFLWIAVLGLGSIIHNPSVFTSINPVYAFDFLKNEGFHAFIILGTVFLVLTGGEALYADVGHFGYKPIQIAWFSIGLPSLLLNYFGQGALLLKDPSAAVNPFYHLAPDWALYPTVVIATLASIIASQAIISGAFSLTLQGMQLGYIPRMRILHTSELEKGQIYIPFINWTLLIATLILVIEFKSSSNLAAAYGISITTTMLITTILAFFAMKDLWKWSIVFTILLIVFFLTVDLAFWSANMLKVADGGWVPLALGLAVYIIMTTWNKGREILRKKLTERTQPLDKFIDEFLSTRIMSISGTAIYMYSNAHGTPPALAQNLKHNKILHKQIIILSIIVQSIPRVKPENRIEILNPAEGFYRVRAYHGFMEQPSIDEIIQGINEKGVKVNIDKTTFYLGREIIIPDAIADMSRWREKIFVFMARNSQRATEFFKLPPDRVYEVGTQVNI
jgi:KUP system potassium uptake protein